MRFFRRSDYVWSAQPARPVLLNIPLIAPLIAALITGVGIAAYRYQHVWTPLQRHYLGSYVRSGAALSSRGSYELWQLVDRTGHRLALDEELVTVTSASGETSFALSNTAVKAGATGLVWQRDLYDPAALHRFLRRWIYHDQTLVDLAQPAFWGAFALFLGGVIGARSEALVHARALREQYLAREEHYARASAIIDYVPSKPRSQALPLVSADRSSSPAHMAIPGRLPESSTRAIAAGEVTRPRRMPHTSPGSWSDPFFK